jgi:hypothetical protein
MNNLSKEDQAKAEGVYAVLKVALDLQWSPLTTQIHLTYALGYHCDPTLDHQNDPEDERQLVEKLAEYIVLLGPKRIGGLMTAIGRKLERMREAVHALQAQDN